MSRFAKSGQIKTLALAFALSLLFPPGASAAWYDNENTFMDRGQQAYNAGQFDQAIAQLTECIKLNANRADAYYWRAMALTAIKQTDRALADLNESIRLAPDCASCYLHRGLIYSNQHKEAEAIADFDEALKLDPNLNEAQVNKNYCLKEIERAKIAAATPQPKADLPLAIATAAGNTSGAASGNTAGGTANKTTSGKASSAGQSKQDPQLLKLEKELELKAQQERLEAERVALARAKAEAETKRLALKERELDERLSREKQKKDEAEARKLALASKDKPALAAKDKPAADPKSRPATPNAGGADESPLEIVNRPIRDKWALIIGISDFQDSKLNLRYPAKDAKDFYDFLVKEANFATDHVKLLTNKDATRKNILSELGDKWLPRVANPDDLVLIYISSHGSASDMDIGGTNYVLAYDSEVDNLYASGLPMQDLTKIIKARVHSDRVVLVLDACHSGAADAGAKGLFRKGNLDAEEVAQGTGQLVISSSQPTQVSWESKNYQNSVFTRRLIESLRSKGMTTTLGEAFENMRDTVQEEVLRERGVLQTPVLKSRWKGNDLRLSSPPANPRPGLVE
jgi:tetratricopeptide (TPR) repeat protein